MPTIRIPGWLLRAVASCLFLAATSAAFAQQVTTLTLSTKDMVYDRSRDRLYASVPGSVGANGNSIAVINPHTATVENHVWVGSEPNQLALSDDGRYLYVGIDGAYSIRRVDLATMTPGILFSVGLSQWSDPLRAGDIAVLPGEPDSIAVARTSSYSSDYGIAIFTNGSMRPAVTTSFGPRLLAFSSSSSRLYGFNSGSSGADFYQFTVDATGVRQAAVAPSMLAQGSSQIVFDHGALYASSGEVVDPETFVGIGRLPLGGGSLAVDSAARRCYLLVRDYSSSNGFLRAYDLDSFTIRWTLTLPGAQTLASLLQVGPTAFAYRTDTSIVQVNIANTERVAVSKSGTGEGAISSTPAGISCGEECASLYPAGTSVTLTASPYPGSRFVGWEGDADCADGAVSATAATACTAVFAQLSTGIGRQLPLVANKVVYSPATGKFYASVPGWVPDRGNTITVVDPLTGALGPSVWVGSEPNRMAVSSDGGTLYVGLDGATALRPLDLATLTPGPQFQLGRGARTYDGRYAAGNLAVQPGNPDVVAAVRVGESGRGYPRGIALYTNGVAGSLTTSGYEGEEGLTFNDTGTRLYGNDHWDTTRLSVVSSGVVLDNIVDWNGNGNLAFAQGRLYFGNGVVVEPESGTFLGTFPRSSNSYSDQVAPSPGEGLAYFAHRETSSPSGVYLTVFDLSRFTLVESKRVSGTIREPTSVAVTGSGQVAVTIDQEPLVLFTRGEPVTHTIAIGSMDPGSDLSVNVAPIDQHGLGGGVTPFSRTYEEGTSITLSAPATTSTGVFYRWEKNGYPSGFTSATVTFTVTESATYVARYRYPRPTVTSISPNIGPTSGGTHVVITGQDFRPGAYVYIGESLATSVVFVSSSTITATTPPQPAGFANVIVVNVDNQYSTLPQAFAYAAAPGVFLKGTPATGSGSRPTSLSLAWAPSTAAAGYEYCLDTTADNACDGNAWVNVGTATASGPLSLELRTTYYWQVRATNAYGTTEALGGWWRFSTGLSPLGAPHIGGDVDGDRLADLTVWRPDVGLWYSLKSGDGYAAQQVRPVQWGTRLAGDIPAPGDYDGDGKMDYAVWRPGTGTWWVLLSGGNYATYIAKPWGLQAAGDVPTPGDYDGDGKTDFAFWRPSAGTWWVLLSGENYTTYLAKTWGLQAAGDIPAPGDYDGDGKTDLAFWRPSAGAWWVLLSRNNYTTYLTRRWGTQAAGDVPMPGDYDGDGRTDMAFWRPATGTWWVLKSSTDYSVAFAKVWGAQAAGDVPMPADYDGDGTTDIAFWRPITGSWWVLQSSGSFATYVVRQWGVQSSGDTPVREK